jgi:2-polyprenyl-3-methyl-5-hydroxy-6-metoxy-1,4-benzoquinol methylase
MEFKTINLSEMRPKGFISQNKILSDEHVEKVKANAGFKNLNGCPVCSSAESDFFLTKSSINYLKCRNCRCTYPSKIPNDVGDIYKNDEYLDEFIVVDGEREEYKKKRFGLERFEILRNQLGGDLQGKKLLDVGCGTGWFIELCKEKGLVCYGQELGSSLANYTRNRTGATIFEEPIDLISGYDNYFDIIVLFDLIEHLENPISFINKLKSMMKDGGILFVMTPNVESFGVNSLRENSSLLIPTDHICLFSPQTINVFSKKVGMKLEWISYNGIDIGDYLANLEFENYSIDEPLKQRIYNDLQPLLDRFSYSNHLRFILKKEHTNEKY